MKNGFLALVVLCALSALKVQAFRPLTPPTCQTTRHQQLFASPQAVHEEDKAPVNDSRVTSSSKNGIMSSSVISAAAACATTLLPSEPALAATAFAPNALPAALAAYGHFVGLIGAVASLMYERCNIRPNMSEEEEKKLAIADISYGAWGLLVVISGYYRLTATEKGWDFYSHEPLFWLKMSLFMVLSASSFFNTTKIIQRSITMQQNPESFVLMDEALAARMIQLCNAQLTAFAFIPLAASTMARGIAYAPGFPWQVEAGGVGLILVALSYKYIKEALEWEANHPIMEE